MNDTAENIWRDFTTLGVPASGSWKPRKSEIRKWGKGLESAIAAGLSNGGLIYDTKTNLDLDLAHDANASAWVMEGTEAGIYRKSGASGSGSWARIADLPYNFIPASNVGAGTANAIVATTSIPVPTVDGATLLALPIVANNDASPVTVAFNGDDALTIKTVGGVDVSIGALKAGSVVAGYKVGTTFRLFSEALSLPGPEAYKVLAWNSAGIALENRAVAGDGSMMQPVYDPNNVGADAFDSANHMFVQTGTGAVERTVQEKLRDFTTAKDFGAAGDGTTNDLSSLQNMMAGGSALKIVQDGDYNLGGVQWRPAAADVTMLFGGGVEFSTQKVDLRDLILYQSGPVASQFLVRKRWTADWLGYGNIFQFASYATTETPNVYEGGGNVVAVYGGADAAGDKSAAWGGNFVAYANHATAKSIGIELNCGTLVSGGESYGLVIASAGNFQPKNAIQIQTNSSNSQFEDGIRFSWRNPEGLLTGNVIRVKGETGAQCDRFIYATSVAALLAEVDLPSFAVEATQGAAANRVQIRGSDTGETPRLTFTGTDTNVNGAFYTKNSGAFQFMSGGVENFRVGNVNAVDSLEVRAGTGAGELRARGASTNSDVLVIGKGTGGVRIQDGAGTNKIRVNTTGIGFFNTTPTAQKTMAAATGTATRTTFDTATVTTAQLAERVKALIDDFRAFGTHA